MSRVLVTGASGFLGRALLSSMAVTHHTLIAAFRKKEPAINHNFQTVLVGDLSKSTDWSSALNGVDVIIHTAARVHIMNDIAKDSLAMYRKVNFEGTMALANQAIIAGVKRFIFISSIKVNGEETSIDKPFKPDNISQPVDPYGISKAETEQALLELAEINDFEVVIIRPVLVYGPGVKANFLNMMSWLNRGIPLPFGSVKNKRSFLALENLVSFIVHCVNYKKTPKAANQVFLVSDGEDISTTELLKKTAKALGKRAWLFPVPVYLMKMAAKIVGKVDMANRLFGSLQVDSSKTSELLGWYPVITMDEQLKKTADAFLEAERFKK